jgi:outer membrane protein assembly factor BamB
MKSCAASLIGMLLIVSSLQGAKAQQDAILTYRGDQNRSGNFAVPGLTPDKAQLAHLDQMFDARVAGHLYAQPLYWHAPGSNDGMLLVATEDDVVQAFDVTTGRELWQRSVGPPVPASLLPCGNINPLGITGTPVIDPATQAIYFDAAVEGGTGPRHEVFGLSLRDGAILPGWPVDIADVLRRSGRNFDPRTQNQRAALTLLDGTLYVAFGGHFGDCGDYHGWIVGLPLRSPRQPVSFETRARGGGIWAPGGLSVLGDHIFFSTGNTFGASTWNDGEAVFRVAPDLQRSESKRDYFAPSDWKMLDARDEDLGGSNPLPFKLPTARGSGEDVVLALGKDRKAYLLDGNDLGGIGGQLAAATVSEIRIITAPAAYTVGGDVFVALQAPGADCPNASRNHDLTVLKITGGSTPSINTAWCGAVAGRGSPIVTTTDGHSDPIVWMLGAEGDNRLHAFRGDTGEAIFTGEPLKGLRHFQTLIATQDRLYVGADDRVYAFDLRK